MTAIYATAAYGLFILSGVIGLAVIIDSLVKFSRADWGCRL